MSKNITLASVFPSVMAGLLVRQLWPVYVQNASFEPEIVVLFPFCAHPGKGLLFIAGRGIIKSALCAAAGQGVQQAADILKTVCLLSVSRRVAKSDLLYVVR